jgi:chromosome segregation ATPase
MEFPLLPSSDIFTMISYIITIVIGGVGYKYIDRFLTFKKENSESEVTANKLLFDSMFSQINGLTSRINILEQEREKHHLREVAVTHELASAKTEVNHLKEKIKALEQKQQSLVEQLSLYEKKYGELTK